MTPRTWARPMSVTTTSHARLAGGLLAAGLGLTAMTGCSFGSENVSCTTSSCTVTLVSSDAQVELLGTTLAFEGTQDGRASLTVGSADVTCVEGENVAAGGLSLECSSVSADSVELTASLG